MTVFVLINILFNLSHQTSFTKIYPLRIITLIVLIGLVGLSSIEVSAQNPINKQGVPVPLGFVMPNGLKKVSIPFELHDNLIVIKVLLNRALPLSFILDTGVRTTVLTEKTFMDLLNLSYSRKIVIPGVGGEKLVDAYVANDVTITVGNIEGRGHALLVLEEDLLQLKNYLGVNVHGIIGYELFSRFIVKINYGSRQITFYDPDKYKKKMSYSRLPLQVEDTKPYITASVVQPNGSTLDGKFMIDTGASHSILLDQSSDSSIVINDRHIFTNLGRGLGGNIFGNVGRVAELSISKYDFKDVIAIHLEKEHYDVDLSANYRNGSLGGGILSRFVVMLDYIHGYLYLKKGPKYHKPFEFNLSGLVVRAAGRNLHDYYIDNIRDGCSAAGAGLIVGDKIQNVNGESTNNLGLDDLIGILNKKANKRIRMVVLRNNQLFTKTFVLERTI